MMMMVVVIYNQNNNHKDGEKFGGKKFVVRLKGLCCNSMECFGKEQAGSRCVLGWGRAIMSLFIEMDGNVAEVFRCLVCFLFL